MLSGDVKRVSEEFSKAYLSAVYGRVYDFVASEGASECSGLVWCRKCPALEKLHKAKIHAPDTFETSKYQNLPILAL